MGQKIKLPLRELTEAVVRDLQEKYPEAEVSLELHHDKNKVPMSESYFWEIISLLDWEKEGDDDAVIEPAIVHLAGGPVRHIFEFADLLSEKLYALDGIDYAREIGEDSWSANQYFSVDTFLYARCCVIANGREIFEKVLDDPRLMPKDQTFESLLYIPLRAFERKTGHAYDYIPAHPIETYSNKEGWNKLYALRRR